MENQATCKGSLILGTACGNCLRCKEEIKKIKQELEKMREKVAEVIEQREIAFEEKSERWQKSEKGEMYQDKTGELESVDDSLAVAIDQIDDFLE